MPPLFLQAKTSQQSIDVGLFVQQFWPMLLVLVLGLIAVYLLLPRLRRYPMVFGILFGVLSLVLAGMWLIRPEPALVETILFYVFAGIAILFGGMMISQRQPVHAALSFAMVVLSTCGLFLLQAAPFLMAATIIIYAGAIVVTFLFVIMLAQQSGLDNADYRSREPLLATIAGFVLLTALLFVLQRDYGPEVEVNELENKIVEYQKRIEAGEKAANKEEMLKALGDQSFLQEFQEAVKSVEGVKKDNSNYKYRLADKLTKIQGMLAEFDEEAESNQKMVVGIQKDLHEISALTWRLQNELRGILQPDEELPLSPFSGVLPNQNQPPLDRHGKIKMPADNVAAIGSSLFTDYLVGVELAATLLLVATIGAIAIAGRRTEGLK